MGDSDDESSNYTGSQQSEREEDEISDGDQTVNQNGSLVMMPIPNHTDVMSEENSVNVPLKSNKPNLNFTTKFNSVAPLDHLDQQNSFNNDSVSMRLDGQPNVMDRRVSHQTGIRDTTGLGQTSLFFSGPNGLMASQVSGLNSTMQPRNLLDAERNRRRNKKNKKNQKQKLLLKLQLAERAKLALDGKVCRICLGEENEPSDPLISPCKCAGTMSHIHLECLREWLNSKRSRKDGEYVKTYCWKALECELCQQRFPG